ncbi:restriction endonuclease S subunits-like protein [Acinetobacter calcoaceticus]|uniref:restriction endonuclease subunit S n=1 Tax=Acinetobacter calcoaceticus TaxID=471 RepID=UPI0005825340|nr:restriction endonuclease subunit S [Acinetobacter calcoaceticus]GAM31962.1 restriction endonuclease S subunits-like protein [Acinetobacter calcoaceticus]
MSNNQLTKSDKVKNVPKLRFEEFRNSDAWEAGQLSDLSNFKLSNGVFNDPKKVGSGYKLINVSDMYIGAYIDEEKLSLINISETEYKKNKVEYGDIFFTRSSIVKSGIAYSNIYLGHSDNVTFDGHLIKLRPNSKTYSSLFIHYLLKTHVVRSQLVARGKTTTMTTIGQEDVASVKLHYPKKTEQQKIAACLSSLDELIQNESIKLETYKQHKSGLLQQLFPKNGESLPSLRFDEFSENWEEISSEKAFSRIKTKNSVGETNVLTISAQKGLISQEEYFNKSVSSKNVSGYYLIKKGEFAYNKSYSAGYPMGAIKKLSRYKQGVVSPLYICFSIDDKIIDSEFFQYYCDAGFLNSELGKIAQEGARNHGLLNIGLDDFFKNIIFKIPKKKEQEKIASCLISLDEAITNQNNYIENLKEYKKGLMQQLFPVLEDVSA